MFSDEQLQTLYGYSYTLCNNDDEAHDLLYDAVEKCLQRPPKKPGALLAYARTIMRNQFIDNIRHHQRFPEVQFDESDGALDMDARLLEELLITKNELEYVWPQLDQIEREILYLWAIDDFSTSQIAELMEKPRGTILARLHRLRKKFTEDSMSNTATGVKKI